MLLPSLACFSLSYSLMLTLFCTENRISLFHKEGGTFFTEGHGGFVSISSTKTAHDCLNLVLEGTLQFGFQWAIEQPLALAQGERRTAQHLAGQRLHLSVKKFRLDQAMEQPNTLGDGGFHDVCEQDDLPRHALSNQLWEQHSGAACDDHAHTRFHTSHARTGAGDAKIAGQSQFEAPTQSITIHGRDAWLLTHQ